MITFDNAVSIIRKAAAGRTLGEQRLPLADCIGRVCASDIASPLDIQPFDNSAMDGFAVRRADLAGASASSPAMLTQTGEISAGPHAYIAPLAGGCCAKIMTGAPIPEGADAVVPIELVNTNAEQVTFFTQPKPQTNIRFAGEDFAKNMPVLRRGETIRPETILPLATLGLATLAVRKRPSAVIFTTGDELIDDLSQPLTPGQIYNSNLPYMSAKLAEMGIDCIEAASVRDEINHFVDRLGALEDSAPDFIISSGAVSAGSHDFVKEALQRVGAEILFHRIQMKPGKPNLFARLPSGSLYFGLPGNPVATAVGLRFFVQSALWEMLNLPPEAPTTMTTVNGFRKKPGLSMLLKARFQLSSHGNFVEILPGQASFMVKPFLTLNGWVKVTDAQQNIEAGDTVEVYPASSELPGSQALLPSG